MPSIFIWKTSNQINSQTTLQYYSGTDWFLEEHVGNTTGNTVGNTTSYTYIDQHVLSTKTHDTVLLYNAIQMPHNWIGSELLEMIQVPYQFIKQDNYGKLEQLGTWMRCIINKDYDSISSGNEFMGNEFMTNEFMTNEFMNILKWSNYSVSY